MIQCCFCHVHVCFPRGGWISGWSRETCITIWRCVGTVQNPAPPVPGHRRDSSWFIASFGGLSFTKAAAAANAVG